MFAAISRPFSAIVSSLRPKKSTKIDGDAEGRADAPKARTLARRNLETRPFERLPESLPAAEPGPARAKPESSAVLAMLLRNETTKSDPPSASTRAQTLAAPQLHVPTTRPAETVRPEVSTNNGGPVQGILIRPLKAQTLVTPAVVAHPLPALPVPPRQMEHGGAKISTDTAGGPRASILADKPPTQRSVLAHPLPALPVSLRPTEPGGVKINMDTPPSSTNKPRAPILQYQDLRPVSVHLLPAFPALPAKIGTDTSNKHGTPVPDHQTPTRPSVMAHPFFELAMSLRPIEPTNKDAKIYMNAPPPARVKVPRAHKAQPPPTGPVVMENPSPVLPASLNLKEPTNGYAAPSRWGGPANRNEISTDTPPDVEIRATQSPKPQPPTTGPVTANPFAMPQHPIEPTDGDEICRDAIAYVETKPSQIRKVQAPGTPPARLSVMAHPFFALAMSLRPIGSDEDTGESADSPPTRIGKPKDRTPEPKSPTGPAAMTRPFFEPTVSLHRKESTNSVEASTQIPDALPAPQRPDLRGLKRPNHKIITPGSTPERPAAQYLLGEEAQGRKCPQCPPSRRPFGTQVALQMHLASGYHERESNALAQPSRSDYPETSPRTSSRGTSRQGDSDPATPPPQGGVPSRVSTRDAPVSAFASALIQQINTALSGTTRVTILDHLLQGIETDLPETQSTRSPPTFLLY